MTEDEIKADVEVRSKEFQVKLGALCQEYGVQLEAKVPIVANFLSREVMNAEPAPTDSGAAAPSEPAPTADQPTDAEIVPDAPAEPAAPEAVDPSPEATPEPAAA